MPLVIGVTGSIATGKSGLCQRLVERWQATHCDADKLVHRMYDPGKPAFDRIVGEFGDDIVGDDGYVDRKVLGTKVFGSRERMGKLTGLIGDIAGEVKGVIDGWRETLPGDAIAVMEAVNLIEAGYSAWCEQTWLVAADDDVALQRMIDRDGFGREEASQRLASQRSWRQREPASDHVFQNNGTLEEFIATVDAETERLRAAHLAGELSRTRWFEWREQNPPPARRGGEQAGRESAGS